LSIVLFTKAALATSSNIFRSITTMQNDENCLHSCGASYTDYVRSFCNRRLVNNIKIILLLLLLENNLKLLLKRVNCGLLSFVL